jgi:hypothetical protein
MRGQNRKHSEETNVDSAMQRLEAAADRLELTELMNRYAWAIDKWDWQLLASLFTEDARADYSAVGQYVEGDGIVRGRDAIVAWLQTSLLKFPDVLHFMSNTLVELDGDRARVITYMHVLHMPMGGIYHCDAVRAKSGWQISGFRLEERDFSEPAARLLKHMQSMQSA